MVTPITVYLLLRAVKPFSDQVSPDADPLPDPVEFPRTISKPMTDAMMALDPRVQSWINEWLASEFTHMPEKSDYIRELRGITVDCFEGDYETAIRQHA